MTLTLDEVRKTKFHMARRTGYEVSEVDLFVDRVEASFAQLTEENAQLKQQVEALKQAQGQSRQRTDRREPSNDELTRQTPAASRRPAAAQPQAPAQGARESERLVVSTSADASPAVVRLVQMATEQSEQLVNEAAAEAKRKVDEATQKAQHITAEAQTKSERLGSEARANADRVTSAAQARAADIDRQAGERRTELFANLEKERDQLQDAVGQLRSFEADYRQKFSSYLQEQLQAVDGVALEPATKPALAPDQAKAQPSTPRAGAPVGDKDKAKEQSAKS